MAKILVVDDEPANRALIRAYLADTQHEVLEASDGETSLALIAEAAPDLVLLDVLMPGLDGFATLRRLRERHDGPFLPVLLVTALSDQTSKRRGLEAGADDFLLKPVDPTELLLRVGNLLRLRDKSIEQRARNEELAELHRFKDEMVGLLVHDLKNPLSALSANLAYIQGESASMPEEVVAALNDSSKCARRLGDLLQNLADTQRAEVAALRPTLAPVALREWLMSFKGAREWEAREHGLHLEIDADGGLRGLFDAALLSRVVENLLDNALRYTPRDGRIVLLAEAAPDGVTISVGSLQAPPEGFATPLSIKVVSFANQGPLRTSGRFVLLDNRVPPILAGTQPARLYVYDYSYSPNAGFHSTLVSSHTIPLNTEPPTGFPNGTVYPGSIALLPDGGVVVTCNFTGALWVSDASYSNWSMALIDPRLGPGMGDDVVGVARKQGGGTRPYTLRVPGPFGPPMYPGVHSVTYAARTDEVAFVRTASPGGIWAISRAALLDGSIPPFAKGALMREVVAPTVGLSDLTDALDYDRFQPTSEWLYWQRAPSDVAGGGFNTLRRVSLLTGEVQVVAKSNTAFDWANEISALPAPLGVLSHLPVTWILSSVGQEHNNPDVNVLLGGVPTYVSPAIMPITIIDAR